MSAENESSMTLCTNRQTMSIARCRNGASSPSLFRPWAVALIGLAIAVALWGYGYKISRYNSYPDPTYRASFSKLWDKHQDVTQLDAAARPPARPPHLQLAVYAALLLHFKNSVPDRHAFVPPYDCPRTQAYLQPVVPLRSPPSGNLAV